jgi:predicted molibdopterin-dependent oxidoreductase YjgC
MKDLRIPGLKRQKPVTIRVNGHEVNAYEGELLHAVLAAAGFRTLRKSYAAHEPRGFFCGMGLCQECLVTVDGVPNVRSCETEVVHGMTVETDE